MKSLSPSAHSSQEDGKFIGPLHFSTVEYLRISIIPHLFYAEKVYRMAQQKQKKFFKIKISILHKIMFCGVLLVFLTVGISTYIVVKTETEVLTGKLIYQGRHLAKDIAYSFKKAFPSSDLAIVTELLTESTAGKHGEVIYTRIVKPDGKIYMADDRSFCGKAVDPSVLVKQEATFTNHFFPAQKESGVLLVHSFTIDSQRWYVMVGLSSKSIKTTTSRLIFHNLISGSFAVLLGAIVSFLLAKSICKPIIALTGASKIIADGDLEHRVTVETNDEVGELARTFNDMAVKLKKSYTNLEKNLEELATEKELLSITLGGMSEGLIAVDIDKRIILFNEVAENLCGWKFKEVEGKLVDEVFQIINEQTEEPLENPIEKALQSKEAECGTQYDVLVSRDGSRCPVYVSAAPIRKTEGEVVGVVMVFRDVSYERELDRMKTDFVSSVSHELRTPLTSIKAYTETILNDKDMPEETRWNFMDVISEETNRLANLIEDLLEVSRIEAGTAKIELDTVDVTAIIEKVLTALKPLANKKNIELETHISNELPQLPADESKIESVITNLINNAIKFTPENGRVSISVETANDQMSIRISDTGMGIPAEALPKIFNRFYRVYRPGKQIQGTGLGLSIVNKIVEMHNGRIEVESEVDRGTTFTVFIPLTAEHVTQSCHS